jgi:hypothetical protein
MTAVTSQAGETAVVAADEAQKREKTAEEFDASHVQSPNVQTNTGSSPHYTQTAEGAEINDLTTYNPDDYDMVHVLADGQFAQNRVSYDGRGGKWSTEFEGGINFSTIGTITWGYGNLLWGSGNLLPSVKHRSGFRSEQYGFAPLPNPLHGIGIGPEKTSFVIGSNENPGLPATGDRVIGLPAGPINNVPRPLTAPFTTEAGKFRPMLIQRDYVELPADDPSNPNGEIWRFGALFGQSLPLTASTANKWLGSLNNKPLGELGPVKNNSHAGGVTWWNGGGGVGTWNEAGERTMWGAHASTALFALATVGPDINLPGGWTFTNKWGGYYSAGIQAGIIRTEDPTSGVDVRNMGDPEKAAAVSKFLMAMKGEDGAVQHVLDTMQINNGQFDSHGVPETEQIYQAILALDMASETFDVKDYYKNNTRSDNEALDYGGLMNLRTDAVKRHMNLNTDTYLTYDKLSEFIADAIDKGILSLEDVASHGNLDFKNAKIRDYLGKDALPNVYADYALGGPKQPEMLPEGYMLTTDATQLIDVSDYWRDGLIDENGDVEYKNPGLAIGLKRFSSDTFEIVEDQLTGELAENSFQAINPLNWKITQDIINDGHWDTAAQSMSDTAGTLWNDIFGPDRPLGIAGGFFVDKSLQLASIVLPIEKVDAETAQEGLQNEYNKNAESK